MNRKIPIGIIGFGYMGRIHAENAIKSNLFEIKAVSDIDENALRVATSNFHIDSVYSDDSKVLERKDIEAVIISTYTNTHLKLITEAAKLGKHIFCEKPFTLNYKEAKMAYNAIKKNNVKFQLGLVLRYTKTYTTLLNYVRNNDKNVIGAQGRYGGFLLNNRPLFDKNIDRGIINGNVVSLIDILQFLLGDVKEVYARFNKDFPKNPEISCSISFLHKNMTISNLYASGAMRLESFLFINTMNKDYLVESNIKLFEISETGKTQILSSELGFKDELVSFYNYITNDIPTLSGVEEALKLSILIEKIYESAQKGRPLSLKVS